MAGIKHRNLVATFDFVKEGLERHHHLLERQVTVFAHLETRRRQLAGHGLGVVTGFFELGHLCIVVVANHQRDAFGVCGCGTEEQQCAYTKQLMEPDSHAAAFLKSAMAIWDTRGTTGQFNLETALERARSVLAQKVAVIAANSENAHPAASDGASWRDNSLHGNPLL